MFKRFLIAGALPLAFAGKKHEKKDTKSMDQAYKNGLLPDPTELAKQGCPVETLKKDCDYSDCRLSNETAPYILDDCHDFFGCMCKNDCMQDLVDTTDRKKCAVKANKLYNFVSIGQCIRTTYHECVDKPEVQAAAKTCSLIETMDDFSGDLSNCDPLFECMCDEQQTDDPCMMDVAGKVRSCTTDEPAVRTTQKQCVATARMFIDDTRAERGDEGFTRKQKRAAKKRAKKAKSCDVDLYNMKLNPE